MQRIAIDQIRPDPDQPRKHFSKSSLQKLAASIKRAGQKVPIIVTQNCEGYLIVDGERRWRACQLAGTGTVKAIVADPPERRIEDQVVANFHREEHTPQEVAQIIRRLRDAGRSMEEIAELFGKSPLYVWHYSRLNELAPEIAERVCRNRSRSRKRMIPMAVAVRLADLEITEQRKMLPRIVGLSAAAADRILAPKSQREVRRRHRGPEETAEVFRNWVLKTESTADRFASMSGPQFDAMFREGISRREMHKRLKTAHDHIGELVTAMAS